MPKVHQKARASAAKARASRYIFCGDRMGGERERTQLMKSVTSTIERKRLENFRFPPVQLSSLSIQEQVDFALPQAFRNHPTRDTSVFVSAHSIEEEERDESEECHKCGNVGEGKEVVTCDSCNYMFHLDCLEPPLSGIPHHDWYCDECTKKLHNDMMSKVRKQSPTRSRTRSRNRSRGW